MEQCHQLACCYYLLILFSYTTQDHLPKSLTTYSELYQSLVKNTPQADQIEIGFFFFFNKGYPFAGQVEKEQENEREREKERENNITRYLEVVTLLKIDHDKGI